MNALPKLRKYPRTPHLEGSRLQLGDEDLDQVPFSELKGRYGVVEEKVDGAQCGISFTPDGKLWLQSRGHYLLGGSANEEQFGLVKAWAHTYSGALRERLGSRYIMYGDNLAKKHSIFYDALPHYFIEFDVLDTEANRFLSTAARRRLLEGLPIVSAPVLYEGTLVSLDAIVSLLGSSRYRTTAWREAFEAIVRKMRLDLERAWQNTDRSDLAEGLYVKLEEGDYVVRLSAEDDPDLVEARCKWVRHDFVQQVLRANEDSQGHVMHQPMILNQLAPGVDLWNY